MPTTPIDEPKNFDAKKLQSIIEKEAFKFRDSFISNKALYEINIKNSTITTIIRTLRIVPGDLSKSAEEKLDIYYKVFDSAHDEVLNNLYLNSYTNYVHQQNKLQSK